MKYFSTAETARKWGISAHRVTILAREGRISGARRIGSCWMIPEDAEKPTDGRRRIAEAAEGDFFRFPVYLNGSAADYEPPLSEEERLLRQAQLDFHACRFEEADAALLRLSTAAESYYVRLSALLHRCVLMFPTMQISGIAENVRTMMLLFSADTPHNEEVMLLQYLHEVLMGFPRILYESYSVKPEYAYSPSCLDILCVFSVFTLGGSSTAAVSDFRLDVYEAMCRQLECSGRFFEAQLLHIQLTYAYKIQSKAEYARCHMRKALRLAEEKELLFLVAANAIYLPDIFADVSPEFPQALVNTIYHHAKKGYEGYVAFNLTLKKPTIFGRLSATDHQLAYLAAQRLSNRQIADIMQTSTSYISKRYSEIYQMLGIGGRQELIDLYTVSYLQEKQRRDTLSN